VIKPKILISSQTPTEAYNSLDTVALRSMHPLHASMVVNYRQLASYIFPCLGDRLEMANHVEGRTPFLDNDLTDFIATIPPRFLIDIDSLQEKAVLYTAFKDFLPKATSQTHKHPFFAPDWATLSRSKPGKAIFKRYLANRALAKTGLFNVQTIAFFKCL
jgi:asparagine synthase (glutamine-hydrolysing)